MGYKALMGCVSLIAISGGVAAQEADSSGGYALEEIVVSATKRVERLVDVPTSVSAVNSDMIENVNARSLDEISNLIPNVTIKGQNGLNSVVSIRGVGSTSRNIGFDTRVGVYIDGVYLGQSPALNQELVDLEQVEVLKGPQGALFGKNTVAGAVNLITKKPGDEFEGKARVRLGNYDTRVLSGMINVPLGDIAALKVSASKSDQDGFVKNLNADSVNGTEMANRDRFSWRAALRVDPTANLNMNFSIDGLDVNENPLFGEPISDPFGTTPVPTGAEPYVVDYWQVPTEDREILGMAGDVTYTMDSGYAVRSITSYRETDFNQVFSATYAPYELLYVDYTDNYDQFTEELQLISPQGERLEFLAGLYYYHQDGSTERYTVPGDAAPAYFPDDRLSSIGDVTTESFAIFGNITYDLTERLELGVGFRYSDETKDVDWELDGSASNAFMIGVADIEDDQKFKDFAPTLTLTYDVTDRMVAYARYAEGYKSGGYNLDYVNQSTFDNFLAAGRTMVDAIKFDKETVKNWELGLKGAALDRRLNVALSVFRTTYNDYQVNQFQDLGEGRTAMTITNAAKVKTTGGELELRYMATEKLTVSGAVGILDGKYVSFPGGAAGGGDASGNKLSAPDFESVVGVDYYDTLGDSDLSLAFHADWTYQSSQYSTIDNISTYPSATGHVFTWGKVGSQNLINSNLMLSNEVQGWSVSLWARNLLGSSKINAYNRDFFGTLNAQYQAPRTYGVTLEYRF
ncbi:TonB-dependent receptor [Kordiimonas sediminis]|uniref:TonB-dependent receptor n=1 Tax=Kordiimonas sediminis TaxID=1735581 RepID=A0A919ANQ8_9PROT|nr:TonB-dependent receptor [Kordiimonas sediminis]GHF18932.1 TonB-dependent receptor [Kordiimonas sediminis]